MLRSILPLSIGALILPVALLLPEIEHVWAKVAAALNVMNVMVETERAVPFSQSLSVTPDGGTDNAAEYSSGNSVAFTVHNTSGSGGWFLFACDFTGTITSCESDWDGYVPANTSLVVYFTYAVGAPGSGTLTLAVGGGGGYDEGWYDVTVNAVLRVAPQVYTTPHNGDNRDVSKCFANCFDVVATYSTTASITGDAPRSATLYYRSSQAYPQGLVQLDVEDHSQQTAAKFSLRLKRSNGTFVTFTNGSSELFFTRGTGRIRLAAQYNAASDATGAYVYDAIVTSFWSDSAQRQTVVPVRVLIANEKDSPFGWGWGLAGAQRIHLQSNGGLVITDGTGSVAYFGAACSGCTHASPTGDYTVLTNKTTVGTDSIKYVRTYPDGTKYSFYVDGRLKTVADRFGNTTRYEYDASNRVIGIWDPYAAWLASLTFSYGSDGKLESINESIVPSRASYVNVDASYNITSIVDPEGNSPSAAYASAYTYDANHRMIAFYDRATNGTKLLYDFASAVATDSAPTVLASGQNTRPTILRYSLATASLINPGSGQGTWSSPRPVVQSDTLRATITDPEGHTTRYSLDSWLQPLTITDPLGNVTSIQRNSAKQPTLVTFPGGVMEETRYSGGQITFKRAANGDSVSIRYGLYAQPDSVWGSGAPARRMLLDGLGNAYTVRIDSNSVNFHYDSRGRVDTITSPGGLKTSIQYHWANGNHEVTRWPGGRFTQDSFGFKNRTVATLALGVARRRVEYDVLGREVKSWTEGASPADTVRTYYGRVFIDSVIDGKGQRYSTERNALGWPVKVYDPDALNGYTSFEYNKRGEVTAFTNRRGQVTYRSYDPLGRIVKKWGTHTVTDTFSYAANGTSVIAENSASRDEVYKRASGWVDSVVSTMAGKRYRIWYRPDAIGRLDSVQINGPSGGIVFAGRKVTYDPSKKHVATMRINGASTRLGSTGELNVDTLVYPGGMERIVSRTTANEVWAESFSPLELAQFWRNYGRDSVGGLTSIVRKFGTSYEVRRFRYSGNRRFDGDSLQLASTYCSLNADYGATGSFCATPIAPIVTHDAVGNVLQYGSITGSYGPGNRMTSWNGTSYGHDADGNVTSKGSTQFAWSSDGRLTRVSSGSDTVDFEYNAFGQLVARKHNGATEHYYLWDGEHLLAELDGTASQRVAEYVYLPGADRPLAIVTGGTTVQKVRYTVQDQVGNIIGLFDSSPAVHEDVFYTALGQHNKWGALADTNRLRWKGLIYQEAPVQLYYARARWYDPEHGRFLSEDPQGIGAGINPYIFAHGDPMNGWDPTGEFGMKEIQRFAPIVAFAAIMLATGPFSWAALGGALEVMAATALGSAVFAGAEHFVTREPYWRIMQRNFGMGSLGLVVGVGLGHFAGGGITEVGSVTPFHGYVKSENPVTFWPFRRGAMTFGSAAMYNGVPLTEPVMNNSKILYKLHELGHTIQFFALSASMSSIVDPWIPYGALGALGLTKFGCWWEQVASLAGSGYAGSCTR